MSFSDENSPNSNVRLKSGTKQYSKAAFQAVRRVEDRARELCLQGTSQENTHIRKTFSRVDSELGETGLISEEGVERFFAALGVAVIPDLLRAVMQEGGKGQEGGYDISDVIHIYFMWKDVASVRLPDTGPWYTNPLVQSALYTDYYLIDTTYRTIWNVFMMLCAIVHWIIIFYRDSIDGVSRHPSAGYVTMSFVLSVFYAVDMYLWFNTASTWIQAQQSLQTIRSRYFKTWFIPDLLSMLPIDVILSLSGAELASGIVSHLRLLRLIRAYNAWSISGYVPLTEYFIKFYFDILPLCRMFYVLVALLQVVATLFCIVKKAVDHWEDLYPADGDPYVTALYFVVQTFTTVGYGDIRMQETAELWFAVCIVFLGLLLNGFIIGKLVAIVQLGSAKNRRVEKLRETMAVLEYFDIPEQLQVEILNFQSHVLWHTVDAGFSDVTGSLPASMRDNILVAERLAVIRHIPLFASASELVMVALAKILIHRASKPEEYAVCVTDQHQGLHFLLFGFIDQLDARGQYIQTLKTGDFFGLEGIMDHSPEQYNYKALSYCDLLNLKTKDFHDMLKKYPKFAIGVREYIKQRLGDTSGEEDLLNKTMTSAHINKAPGIARVMELRSLALRLKAFKEQLVAASREM